MRFFTEQIQDLSDHGASKEPKTDPLSEWILYRKQAAVKLTARKIDNQVMVRVATNSVSNANTKQFRTQFELFACDNAHEKITRFWLAEISAVQV